jgi:hypothetical protein
MLFTAPLHPWWEYSDESTVMRVQWREYSDDSEIESHSQDQGFFLENSKRNWVGSYVCHVSRAWVPLRQAPQASYWLAPVYQTGAKWRNSVTQMLELTWQRIIWHCTCQLRYEISSDQGIWEYPAFTKSQILGTAVVVTRTSNPQLSITFWDIIRSKDLGMIRLHRIEDSWREFKRKLDWDLEVFGNHWSSPLLEWDEHYSHAVWSFLDRIVTRVQWWQYSDDSIVTWVQWWQYSDDSIVTRVLTVQWWQYSDESTMMTVRWWEYGDESTVTRVQWREYWYLIQVQGADRIHWCSTLPHVIRPLSHISKSHYKHAHKILISHYGKACCYSQGQNIFLETTRMSPLSWIVMS